MARYDMNIDELNSLESNGKFEVGANRLALKPDSAAFLVQYSVLISLS